MIGAIRKKKKRETIAGNLYSTGALYEHCVAVTIAKCCHCVLWLYHTVTRLYRGGPICNTVTTVTYCSLLYSPIQYLSVLQMLWWQQWCHHAAMALGTPPPPNNRDNDKDDSATSMAPLCPCHHHTLKPFCHSMWQEWGNMMSMTTMYPGPCHHCSVMTMAQTMKWLCCHHMTTTCPSSYHHHNMTAMMATTTRFWSCPPLHLQALLPVYNTMS